MIAMSWEGIYNYSILKNMSFIISCRILWNARGTSLSTSITLSSNTPLDTVVDDIGIGGGAFHDLLTNLIRDTIELRNLLSVLLHFLSVTLASRNQSKPLEISTQTQSSLSSESTMSALIMKIEPTVVIVDTDRTNRMKCPVCSIISSHSSQLATLFSVSFYF